MTTCPHCGGIVGSPQGAPPRQVRDFLAEHTDVPRWMLVCQEHGKWFVEIDHLAPFHWEQCRCEDCLVVERFNELTNGKGN